MSGLINVISSYKTVAAGFDSDAQAFFTATGITDSTQKNAINQLVLDLKAASLWTKFTALYPFVGGTAATHKYNLKDPQDTDGAYRITFTGGWTHDANGVSGNGTNAYGDTHLAPTALGLDSAHLSCWNRSNVDNVYVDMGSTSNSSGGDDFQLVTRLGGVNYSMLNAPNVVGFASSDSSQLHVITRTSSTALAHYRNTTKTTITKTSVTRNSLSIYISARNANGTAEYFDTKQKSFATIGSGLTDTDVSNLYTAITTFNTALGR